MSITFSECCFGDDDQPENAPLGTNDLTGRVPGAYESHAIMSPSDPTPRPVRGESALAFSIMFFAVALLCLMLGWADGVRHGRTYLHIPETGGWLIATGILAVTGVALLVWSRSSRRR